MVNPLLLVFFARSLTVMKSDALADAGGALDGCGNLLMLAICTL